MTKLLIIIRTLFNVFILDFSCTVVKSSSHFFIIVFIFAVVGVMVNVLNI